MTYVDNELRFAKICHVLFLYTEVFIMPNRDGTGPDGMNGCRRQTIQDNQNTGMSSAGRCGQGKGMGKGRNANRSQGQSQGQGTGNRMQRGGNR